MGANFGVKIKSFSGSFMVIYFSLGKTKFVFIELFSVNCDFV